MELKDLIEKKKSAEQQISAILTTLQNETNMTLQVNIDQAQQWSGNPFFIVTINLIL